MKTWTCLRGSNRKLLTCSSWFIQRVETWIIWGFNSWKEAKQLRDLFFLPSSSESFSRLWAERAQFDLSDAGSSAAGLRPGTCATAGVLHHVSERLKAAERSPAFKHNQTRRFHVFVCLVKEQRSSWNLIAQQTDEKQVDTGGEMFSLPVCSYSCVVPETEFF